MRLQILSMEAYAQEAEANDIDTLWEVAFRPPE